MPEAFGSSSGTPVHQAGLKTRLRPRCAKAWRYAFVSNNGLTTVINVDCDQLFVESVWASLGLVPLLRPPERTNQNVPKTMVATVPMKAMTGTL
mgnify:CR=1 FL=1